MGVYDMLLAMKVEEASRQWIKYHLGYARGGTEAGDDDLISIRYFSDGLVSADLLLLAWL